MYFFHLFFGHAQAVVFNGDALAVFVDGEMNFAIGKFTISGARQRRPLGDGIGGIGNQLAQKKYRVQSRATF